MSLAPGLRPLPGSAAYVRHLTRANEILGHHLLTLHNLHLMLTIAREIREGVIVTILNDVGERYMSTRLWDAA